MNIKPKRMGRPPMPVEQRAGGHIHVRATDETIAQLAALAAAWGCDKSDAIRRAIADALATTSKRGG